MYMCLWMDGQAYNVTDDNISKVLKRAAATLQYLLYQGIQIKQIDTHSLRIGRACMHPSSERFFRNAYPKNGQMQRRHVQRVCAWGTSLLLRWHGKGYETMFQIHQCHRTRVNGHYITNCQQKNGINEQIPAGPSWYMRPLTYPSRWGASKSPFFCFPPT